MKIKKSLVCKFSVEENSTKICNECLSGNYGECSAICEKYELKKDDKINVLEKSHNRILERFKEIQKENAELQSNAEVVMDENAKLTAEIERQKGGKT